MLVAIGINLIVGALLSLVFCLLLIAGQTLGSGDAPRPRPEASRGRGRGNDAPLTPAGESANASHRR